jgi:aspartate dehydrogenase
MKKIGIIGCGTIGGVVLEYIKSNLTQIAEVTAICDVDKQKTSDFSARFFLNKSIDIFEKYEDLINNVDLVVETASGQISGDITIKSLKQGKDIVVLSIGGLVNYYDEIQEIVKGDDSGTLYMPTGAISGIDCVCAGASKNIEKVTLTTRKPPKGLIGAPYLIENNIDLNTLGDEEFIVFEGSASDAIKGFPKNVNVAVVLSMAGIGLDKTKVKIITSNKFTSNSHEIYVKGDFGEMTSKTSNVPSPLNPKTSYLAALSACALVDKILSKIKIGN